MATRLQDEVPRPDREPSLDSSSNVVLLPSQLQFMNNNNNKDVSLEKTPPGIAQLLSHRQFLLDPPEDMTNTRKFSYASVKEDSGEGIPQTFESSLSSQELEEIEWIAWPCNQWCKTKGLCSYHSGGSHKDYVEARLEGYAKSNPRKLRKIVEELEKRQNALKLDAYSSTLTLISNDKPSNFNIDAWREKHTLLGRAILESSDIESVVVEDEEDLVSSPSDLETYRSSSLESMPDEILDLIFSYVTVDHTADPYARPRVDLATCAGLSKRLNAAACRVLYRHVSIPQSKAFFKFTRSLAAEPELGSMVQYLDFSHYSSIGFGRTRTTSTQTPYLTPTTLRACLDVMPNLQAFLVHEHVDDELDIKVLSKLFRMSRLQALDLCACSSKPFTEAFTTVCNLMSLGTFSQSLKRLSLHECTTLQEPVFEALLPQLPNLTHLDVAHTLINNKALLSIPKTAEITHLNLERCTRLTGSGVVKFLTKHEAVKDTIIYLNLSADSSRHKLLDEADVTKLLPILPSTLRSLNIGGARISEVHVPLLADIASHVEELGIRGANLSLSGDINRIFGAEDDDTQRQTVSQCAIRYIDLTDIKSVTQMSLSYSPDSIIGAHTQPLEVIEIGSKVLEDLKRRNTHVKNPEWTVRELGRRGWYVRQKSNDTQVTEIDDGYRPWKMGARWWGMRKIPMVEQDVGGMYGYFMFKRN